MKNPWLYKKVEHKKIIRNIADDYDGIWFLCMIAGK